MQGNKAAWLAVGSTEVSSEVREPAAEVTTVGGAVEGEFLAAAPAASGLGL